LFRAIFIPPARGRSPTGQEGLDRTRGQSQGRPTTSQFGQRAERLDDDQLQFGFEDLHADIARVEATLPSTTVKTPRSRPDRPSLPAHLPREDMRLDLEHQACPCCGGELHVIGETVSEMLDRVPARLRVIRICRPPTCWPQSLEAHPSVLALHISGLGLQVRRHRSR
jgi:hypothetical protein